MMTVVTVHLVVMMAVMMTHIMIFSKCGDGGETDGARHEHSNHDLQHLRTLRWFHALGSERPALTTR